jgi:tetratricopeptide (TPR) repeat protein
LSARPTLRAAAALLVAIVALYARALGGAFVIDDRTFFIENDDLPTLGVSRALEVFTRPTNAWGDWQPVRDLAFVVQHEAFGLSPVGHHAVSIALYWVACLLAFLFVSALLGRRDGGAVPPATPWSATIVIAIFVAHPVHVEAVAYVCGQKELLSAVFCLAALLSFQRAFDDPSGRALRLAGGVAFYGLAVLSKQTGVMLAVLVPVLWLLSDRSRRPAWLPTAALWGAVNVPVLLWMARSREAYQALWRTNSELNAVPLLERLPLALKVLGAHSRLAIWPHPLSFGYPFDASPAVDGNLVAGVGALAALGAAAWWYRRDRAVLFGVAVFGLFLAPVLQLHGSLNNASIYDRYLFLSVLGLALLAERVLRDALDRGPAGRRAWLAVAGALALAEAMGTLAYVPAFKDDVAVTENTFRRFPGWNRAPFELAYSLIEAERLDEARRFIASAPNLDAPEWVRPYLQGRVTLGEGDAEAAIPVLRIASWLADAGGYYPFPSVPLGAALMKVGRLEEAERELRRASSSPIYQPLEAYRVRKVLEEVARRRAGR